MKTRQHYLDLIEYARGFSDTFQDSVNNNLHDAIGYILELTDALEENLNAPVNKTPEFEHVAETC